MTDPVQLEIFSDVVCPWCYIGKTKLAEAVDKFTADGGEVEIRYRPYLLHPDLTGPSRPLPEYLAARFGAQAAKLTGNVIGAGAVVGLDLKLDQAIAANSRQAHQLIESAYRDGGYPAQLAVADELFRAHFSRGEDIAEREVLTAAGHRAGLDEKTIEAAFSDPTVAEALNASLAGARELGISAVPTFVANRSIGVQGAHPPATLLALLQKAAEPDLG